MNHKINKLKILHKLQIEKLQIISDLKTILKKLEGADKQTINKLLTVATNDYLRLVNDYKNESRLNDVKTKANN